MSGPERVFVGMKEIFIYVNPPGLALTSRGCSLGEEVHVVVAVGQLVGVQTRVLSEAERVLGVVRALDELVDAVGGVPEVADDAVVPGVGGVARTQVEDAAVAVDLDGARSADLLGDHEGLGGQVVHPARGPAAGAELFPVSGLVPADDVFVVFQDFVERCLLNAVFAEGHDALVVLDRNAEVVDVDECAAQRVDERVGEAELVGTKAIRVTEVDHGQEDVPADHAELVAHCGFSRLE